MNDNNQNNYEKENKKNFFSIFFNHIFHEEPRNREELLTLIRCSEKNDLIDQNTCDMLKGVIDITKQRVRDIMIPRPQMITLKLNDKMDECLNKIIESAYSRFPIMSIDTNYVEGLLIAKDLLPFINSTAENFYVKKFLRPAIAVPESKYVNHMLKEFRLHRYHMAIVIDEFGAVSGLLTIEDILELIVGNIEDEYDNKESCNIRPINPYTFIIQGFTQIKEFNEKFDTNFNDIEVDTIGGLVIKECGRLPRKGEIINIKDYKFKIYTANDRRITQMHVHIPKK